MKLILKVRDSSLPTSAKNDAKVKKSRAKANVRFATEDDVKFLVAGAQPKKKAVATKLSDAIVRQPSKAAITIDKDLKEAVAELASVRAQLDAMRKKFEAAEEELMYRPTVAEVEGLEADLAGRPTAQAHQAVVRDNAALTAQCHALAQMNAEQTQQICELRLAQQGFNPRPYEPAGGA